jgi:hypothetical protein
MPGRWYKFGTNTVFGTKSGPIKTLSPVGTNLVHGLPQRYRFAIAISEQF